MENELGGADREDGDRHVVVQKTEMDDLGRGGRAWAMEEGERVQDLSID